MSFKTGDRVLITESLYEDGITDATGTVVASAVGIYFVDMDDPEYRQHSLFESGHLFFFEDELSLLEGQ